MTSCDEVQASLVSFKEAKEAIEATFGLAGAPAIVNAVLKGAMPREGRCLNGYEYFVHGVGYTVVFPDGGQAHIDGSSDGDLVSLHDVSFFLETSGREPRRDALKAELDKLVSSGALREVAGNKYLV